jgi:hypothetical protein
VFQIFAQLIELRPAPLPATYLAIFPPLLAPVFWERHGNVPALVRLLRAYMAKAAAEIVAQGHLQACGPPRRLETCQAQLLSLPSGRCLYRGALRPRPGHRRQGAVPSVPTVLRRRRRARRPARQAVLGVFQKLVASKAQDHEGFRLLGAVAAHAPLPALSPFLPTVRPPGRAGAPLPPTGPRSAGGRPAVPGPTVHVCMRGTQALAPGGTGPLAPCAACVTQRAWHPCAPAPRRSGGCSSSGCSPRGRPSTCAAS